VEWPFRPLEPLLALKKDTNAQSQDLHLQLQVARKVFFKVWDLNWVYKALASLTMLLIVIGSLGLLWSIKNEPVMELTWGGLLLTLALFVAGIFVPMLQWLKPTDKARSVLTKIAIAALGYLLANIHIHLVDRWFLARGKLDRLLKLKS
jgi:hypothetical protein